MTRDRNKSINLKEGKNGSFSFGNNSSINVLGKGLVELGSDKEKSTNVLLVEDLKDNLPSVSKMCDQEYSLTFNSWKCEIREGDSGILVATTIRNTNKKYILYRAKSKNIEAPRNNS